MIRRGIRTIFWPEWVIELFFKVVGLRVVGMRCVDIGGSATKQTPEGENSFRVGQSADWLDVSDT